MAGLKTGKKMIVNAFGRKWELTFTTLVTFRRRFFASFPLFIPQFRRCILALDGDSVRLHHPGLAYEYRSKPNNFLAKGLMIYS